MKGLEKTYAIGALQLLGTCLILIFVPGNVWKLVACLLLWGLSFGRVRRVELVVVVFVCLFFTGMNVGALKQGVFAFSAPDVLGMPVWELFMWGFYVLHGLRLLGGEVPQGPLWQPLTLAIAFAVPFCGIPDPTWILLSSACILLLALAFFHQREDLLYTFYFIAMGAVIEYTGVLSGLWSYPANPPGGVPLWFITMWGGVGFFVRRLLLRFVKETARNEPHAGI